MRLLVVASGRFATRASLVLTRELPLALSSPLAYRLAALSTALRIPRSAGGAR